MLNNEAWEEDGKTSVGKFGQHILAKWCIFLTARLKAKHMGTLNKLWHFFFFSRRQAAIWQRGVKRNGAASASRVTFHMYNVRYFLNIPTTISDRPRHVGRDLILPTEGKLSLDACFSCDFLQLLTAVTCFLKLTALFCVHLTPRTQAWTLGWCYLMAHQWWPVIQISEAFEPAYRIGNNAKVHACKLLLVSTPAAVPHSSSSLVLSFPTNESRLWGSRQVILTFVSILPKYKDV